MKFRMTSEEFVKLWLPKGTLKVADKQSDAVAYVYDGASDGAPCAAVFFGKQSKPVWRYRFATPAKRQAAIARAFANRRAWLVLNEQRRAARKAFVPTYKVGDIFRTSWGYEQTNIEYFEIVEIKGKYAILRELAQERSETGWAQGRCVPLPGQYISPRYDGDDRGAPIRRLMQDGRIRIDDVRAAWPVETQTVAGIKVAKPATWTAYH